ncbi:hypothetical protein ABW21_db0201242 [Orbilia brochopaga]|nr:hypothetical protein ABW21_db0201242 [Drechslerella brochopaga]
MRYFLLPILCLAWILQITASPVPSYSDPNKSAIYGPKSKVVTDSAIPFREKDCVDSCVLAKYVVCYGSETCRTTCSKFVYKLWKDIDQCIRKECTITTSLGLSELRSAKAFANSYCELAGTLLPQILGTGNK